MPKGFAYFTSNPKRTVVYAGVTSTIKSRMYKHKKGAYEGFAKKYHCYHLLYFEEFATITAAIKREKQMKRWSREWKWKVIKESNPDLKDLSADWFDENGELRK